MEAVKPLDEITEVDTEEIVADDPRTDLQELDDLAEELRTYRRKITKLATAEMKKCFKGQKRSEDKSGEIAEMWKYYKYVENSYNSLLKICYPKGQKFIAGDGTGKPDMELVKSKPSTMGEIERSTRIIQNG